MGMQQQRTDSEKVQRICICTVNASRQYVSANKYTQTTITPNAGDAWVQIHKKCSMLPINKMEIVTSFLRWKLTFTRIQGEGGVLTLS